MRRVGWFLAGATATAVAVWKAPAVRERLLGPDPAVDLPPAPAGQEESAWPPPPPGPAGWSEPDVAEAEPAVIEEDAEEAELDTVDLDDAAGLEAVEPPPDEQADGLRGRIEETRARMRAKAQAEAERTRAN